MKLALMPILPLISFLILILTSQKISWRLATVMSVGSIGLSAVLAATTQHTVEQ